MQWKTKEGQILELSEMTDSHLINAIKYLGKRLAEFEKDTLQYYVFSGGPSGEMAQITFDRELFEREEYSGHLYHTLAESHKEVKSRGLVI